MIAHRLTLRYASGIHAQLLFTEAGVAHAYYHTVVKPAHRNPPVFIVEQVDVWESVACAPSEANIKKI